MVATPVQDLLPMFKREINAPGIELFPTASAGSLLGYIKDGFWDARLAETLAAYTIALGEDITPAQTTGTEYFTDSGLTNQKFPEQFHMMVVLFGGFRMIRLKILNLSVNFKAEAGPVSYEQQASATTLRAVLDSMERRMKELRVMYSDAYFQEVFILMDGQSQATYSLLEGLADTQVLL